MYTPHKQKKKKKVALPLKWKEMQERVKVALCDNTISSMLTGHRKC